MNKISPILVFICIVYSQDIYVDSGMDYEKQYYAKFDRFTKHGGWNNYENASKDEIKLPNNFPYIVHILLTIFMYSAELSRSFCYTW